MRKITRKGADEASKALYRDTVGPVLYGAYSYRARFGIYKSCWDRQSYSYMVDILAWRILIQS